MFEMLDRNLPHLKIWLVKFVYSYKRSVQEDALATLFSDKC